MELKRITPEEALAAIKEKKTIYAVREVDGSITVLDLLTEELAVVVAEDTVPGKAKLERSSRKKLDWGEIVALHNAGWTNTAIAEEVNTTESTIATGLSRLRGKEKKANGEKQGTATDAEAEETDS